MTMPARPIGQDPQSQMLWYIGKEIERLQALVAAGGGGGGGALTDAQLRATPVNSNLVGATGAEATVIPANAARLATDPVLLVQTVDAAGNISAGSSAVDDAAFAVATDKGSVIMGVATTDPVNDGDQGAVAMTLNRELKVMTNAHSYLPATDWSPADGAVTYLTANTLTCTGWRFTVDNTTCAIRSIGVTAVSGIMTLYENGVDGISIGSSANIITILKYGVALAAFLNTDTSYKVAIAFQQKAYDPTVDVTKTIDQSPDRSSYVQDSILDATNITAATNYYPSSTGMSMDGFKDMSITGKFIDADGTMTMTVEASNDEDSATADWVQIYGFDTKNNAIVNSWTITNGTLTFAIDFDNLNYSLFRIVMINNGSTNTGIIKMRRKSL